MKLCSACLLGIPCRYDGKAKPDPKVLELAEQELLVPVCPEQLGGLETPREGCEIVEGRVKTKFGIDRTEAFQKGAESVLHIAKLCGAKQAILKARSPSCGCSKIYDGSFSGKLTDGNGITAELLLEAGLEVICEEDL